jgi:hypothetical protein
MFCWHPTKEEINQWVESKEREFAVKENKSPRLNTEDWLQKHIFTDLHEIFFVTYAIELYDWLSKLADKNVFKKKREVVWTPELIQTLKGVDNPISRAVDFWLASLLEGFITEFAVDQRKSFSEAERYFFKGYRGKYLNSLNLSIKQLLYEKGVLDIFSDE